MREKQGSSYQKEGLEQPNHQIEMFMLSTRIVFDIKKQTMNLELASKKIRVRKEIGK
jgi:hypothetical protein